MNTGADLLARIMELVGKPELTPAEVEELYRLETEWRNRVIAPSECPTRK